MSFKMSDSDEGTLQIDLDSQEQSPKNVKKFKIKRLADSLKLIETEAELQYRRTLQNVDVMKKFSDLIKCTRCLHNFKPAILEGKKIHSHPILGVLMCELCCEFYGSGEFSLDEDGEDKYCRWCGEGGKIFLCSECICGICPRCIKRHFGKPKLKEIEEDDEWKCFICNPTPLWKLRAVCDMAQKQSAINKCHNESVPSDTLKKKQLTRSRNSKQFKFSENSSHDPTINKDGSSPEDSPSSSKETEGSCAKLLPSKRKPFLASNRRGRPPKASFHVVSDDEGEPPKKMRALAPKNSGKKPASRKKRVSSDNDASSTSLSSSSSSSDASEDEDLKPAPAVRELIKRGTHHAGKTKNKNLEKLKDIFSVAETVSELCLKMCRKKIKKLDKNLMSDEKIEPECEKLRSMVILMSCSLSTVHNLIVSLQQKWKMKETLDIRFRGKQDSTFLEAMGKILRTKRMKTSYFLDIVRDILNRYPFIELGVKSYNNYICNSVYVEGSIECVENEPRQCPKVNSDPECDERSDTIGIFKKEFHSSAETLVPYHLKTPDCNATESGLEKFTRDDATGVDHSRILETGSERVSSDNEPSGSLPGVRQGSELGASLQKDRTSNNSTLSLYTESLKLRDQFLLSSSDESSPKGVKSKSSGDSSHADRLSETAREMKEQKSVESAKLSKEDKEIRRLMNLSSLERLRGKESVGYDPGEGSPLEDRESKEVCHESDSSELTVSDGCGSSIETPSCNLDSNANHGYSIGYVQENAAIIRSYFLETTSSSNDSTENSDSEKKPKKVRNSAKSSGKGDKPDRTKTEKSEWRSDALLRVSLSFRDPKSTSSASHSKEGSVKNSNEETDGSDSSLSLLNLGSLTRRKRKRVFLSSSTDSDEPVPQPTVESPTKGRRNIKKIVKTGNLQLETRMAVKAENERKKRVAERRAVYEKSFPNMLESDRLVLDFDPDTKDVLLEVPPELAKKLKPHQKEGIKFMWDCCFESLDSLEKSNGSGCVLAHCMGLGKTLQIITLIFTVMKNAVGVKTCLILCPLNVVGNWLDEFTTWLKDLNSDIRVSNLNCIKGDHARSKRLKKWHKDGGIMVVSYDLMRNLTTVKKNPKKSAVAASFSEFLLNPGPDLVVCDEGHLLKNQGTALSKCIMKMNTSRRIILTGTPLQNNLIEYHSMVQFIKPNILGTRREFMNRFVNPIMNGQFEDSTARDVKLMRARSHVLHKLLDGCIQRFNYSVLTPYLPEKHEYVLFIRLTDSQAKLYQFHIDKFRKSLASNKAARLLYDFHMLQRIWTHPRLLAPYAEKYEDQLDDDSDEDKTKSASSESSVICLDSDSEVSSSAGVNVNELLKTEEYEDIQSSGKLVVLLHILSGCRKAGDKILVFSQSLKHLNLIEYFLHKIHKANESASEDFPAQYRDTWEKGIDYYRMEGSTSYEARTKWCKSFNSEENKRSRLFLISTKAGGMGINLIGANRVVIFDVSWNPSQDVQSIFRVYRFGQVKTCYIYRFVAEGTMEQKIYARQVTKLSLEKRVLDEQQIERHYTMGNLQALYTYDPTPKENWKVPLIPKDMILAEIINNKDLIASYHEHDSLLENKEEEKLTEEERKAAWEDFEREKFMAENQITALPNTDNSVGVPDLIPLTAPGRPQVPSASVDIPPRPSYPLQHSLGYHGHMNNPLVGAPMRPPNFYPRPYSPYTHYLRAPYVPYPRHTPHALHNHTRPNRNRIFF